MESTCVSIAGTSLLKTASALNVAERDFRA
jgi:hypothetical protein